MADMCASSAPMGHTRHPCPVLPSASSHRMLWARSTVRRSAVRCPPSVRLCVCTWHETPFRPAPAVSAVYARVRSGSGRHPEYCPGR